MRERVYHPFGHYQGYSLFYNDTIIIVGTPDYSTMMYVCSLQNHNKKILLSHEEIACLVNLQRVIKGATS